MTQKEVEAAVKQFNEYFLAQPEEGVASIEDYKKCFRCGESCLNFDPIEEAKVPRGVTVQAILVSEEL